ncbi:MAG: pentapeptide repeat-containing protein [Cyanobacteriota bacterium]
MTAFFCWMGWLTLKREDRDPWLRRIVIAFAAVGGTSFYHANLTGADFTQARLKNTNFNQAILNKTSFHSAVKLELARPGKTLLANWRVRELLINPSGGEGQDFRKADLRGANLDNANLKNANLALADLSQASFVNANLQGANLTEVNAVQSDFRQATLTGACVENWNIDSTTILDHVDCQYIYLRNQEKERRPSSGEFAPGEFAKLFAEVFDTVDLIFREGVDWRAFMSTLQDVQVQNKDTTLAVQAIENKGEGVFVVKVNVPPEADKPQLHAQFTETYQVQLQALEAQYQAQLAAKEGQIGVYKEQLAHERQQNTNMMGILNTLASKPTTIEIKQVNQDNSQQINAGRDLTIDADHSTVNLRDLDL